MARTSTLDLTARQVAAIETDLGLPVNRWSEAPSLVTVYAKILAAVNGDSEDRYMDLTVRDLLALVSLDEDDDPKDTSGS